MGQGPVTRVTIRREPGRGRAGANCRSKGRDDTLQIPPAGPALELLGALGLVLPATRSAAGVCLALLFVALVPANIYAAIEGLPLNGDQATPLWFRIPEQIVCIAIALWAIRRVRTMDRHRAATHHPAALSHE